MAIATRVHDLMQRAHFVRETYSGKDDWTDIVERSQYILGMIAGEYKELRAIPEMNRTRKERLRIFFLDYVTNIVNDIYFEAQRKV